MLAIEPVIAAPADQRIVAKPAEQQIIAGIPFKLVIFRPAHNCVCAGRSEESIVSGTQRDDAGDGSASRGELIVAIAHLNRAGDRAGVDDHIVEAAHVDRTGYGAGVGDRIGPAAQENPADDLPRRLIGDILLAVGCR